LRAYIAREIELQKAEIVRQREILRSGHAFPDLTGRHVLFVDDGFATPAVLLASVEAFRRLGAATIVAAIPTQSVKMANGIRQKVDELVISTSGPLSVTELRAATTSATPNSRAVA
jgi:putative phosphoribosyl transferase